MTPKVYNDDGLKIEVTGFCPVDVLEIWKSEKLNSFRYLKGDYFVKISMNNKTVYITDFAGSNSAGKLPRNSTIAIKDNQIIRCSQNWPTKGRFYTTTLGFKRKDNFDDFFEAIDNAVALRCIDNPTITMSCGHDSGVIVASALKQKLQFESLAVRSIEHPEVLETRNKLTNGKILEGFKEGSGHNFIVNHITNNVILTGLGADELYVTGDDELLNIFLSDANKVYGRKNIQQRFPLSDYSVWKEYCSLHKGLIKKQSSRSKKIPFEMYMRYVGFPVHTGNKVSFGI